MESKVCYAAVQNGCILGIFDNFDDAKDCAQNEIKRDFISIVIRRKLRKLFQKSGDVALHKYSVIKISEVVEVK